MFVITTHARVLKILNQEWLCVENKVILFFTFNKIRKPTLIDLIRVVFCHLRFIANLHRHFFNHLL